MKTALYLISTFRSESFEKEQDDKRKEQACVLPKDYSIEPCKTIELAFTEQIDGFTKMDFSPHLSWQAGVFSFF